MKKSLMVVGILVLACSFAGATNWTFGFYDSAGTLLYCNYEQLNNTGFSSVVYGGVDNVTACGLPSSYNSAVAGFAGKLSAAQNPVNFAVKGVVYGDSLYTAFSAYYGYINWYYEWTVATNLKASKKKWGWVGIADYSFSGYLFGDNYGYLTTTIPAKGKVAKMLTTGQKVSLKK
jgi:hypothetical protein